MGSYSTHSDSACSRQAWQYEQITVVRSATGVFVVTRQGQDQQGRVGEKSSRRKTTESTGKQARFWQQGQQGRRQQQWCSRGKQQAMVSRLTRTGARKRQGLIWSLSDEWQSVVCGLNIRLVFAPRPRSPQRVSQYTVFVYIN